MRSFMYQDNPNALQLDNLVPAPDGVCEFHCTTQHAKLN